MRNKNTLREIGELAQKVGAVILLEGGILSHAYYQLIQTEAQVEISNPFTDSADTREFNKLVRDKIPSKIELGGELVSKERLSGEYLLRALKEKLIEESFEVLDAVDQGDILGELADVAEVVDGILHHLGISKDELFKKQITKREKSGGFHDGVILLKTDNPPPAVIGETLEGSLFPKEDLVPSKTPMASPHDSLNVLNKSKKISKWSDQREHSAAKEVILDLEIPVINDLWSENTRAILVNSNTGDIIKVKISGERIGSKIKMGLSVFVPQDQLEMF